MTHPQAEFPLKGVIGIVDESGSQLDTACQFGLRCVEVRADLLRTAGLSNKELLSVVRASKAAGLACLFTLRHQDQGGTFDEDESVRIALCSQALEAGANIIDLEHGTEAASAMLARAAPMILSYHNFKRMLDTTELADLSDAMEQQKPAAVKIIPTGQSIADAATMMAWVAKAGDSIRRIGFSMGSDGAVGRILSMTLGAPVTYASFGNPVAPGQVDIKLLLDRYNCMSMSKQTGITAVIGESANIEQFVQSEKEKLAKTNNSESVVYVGFSTDNAAAVEQYKQVMNLNDIVYL